MPFDSTPHVTLAAQLRSVFGPNGEHWIQGALHRGDSSHCLVGAIYSLGKENSRRQERIVLIGSLLPPLPFEPFVVEEQRLSWTALNRMRIERFNDDAKSFAAIDRFLTRLEEKELADALR